MVVVLGSNEEYDALPNNPMSHRERHGGPVTSPICHPVNFVVASITQVPMPYPCGRTFEVVPVSQEKEDIFCCKQSASKFFRVTVSLGHA